MLFLRGVCYCGQVAKCRVTRDAAFGTNPKRGVIGCQRMIFRGDLPPPRLGFQNVFPSRSIVLSESSAMLRSSIAIWIFDCCFGRVSLGIHCCGVTLSRATASSANKTCCGGRKCNAFRSLRIAHVISSLSNLRREIRRWSHDDFRCRASCPSPCLPSFGDDSLGR